MANLCFLRSPLFNLLSRFAYYFAGKNSAFRTYFTPAFSAALRSIFHNASRATCRTSGRPAPQHDCPQPTRSVSRSVHRCSGSTDSGKHLRFAAIQLHQFRHRRAGVFTVYSQRASRLPSHQRIGVVQALYESRHNQFCVRKNCAQCVDRIRAHDRVRMRDPHCNNTGTAGKPGRPIDANIPGTVVCAKADGSRSNIRINCGTALLAAGPSLDKPRAAFQSSFPK